MPLEESQNSFTPTKQKTNYNQSPGLGSSSSSGLSSSKEDDHQIPTETKSKARVRRGESSINSILRPVSTFELLPSLDRLEGKLGMIKM